MKYLDYYIFWYSHTPDIYLREISHTVLFVQLHVVIHGIKSRLTIFLLKKNHAYCLKDYTTDYSE